VKEFEGPKCPNTDCLQIIHNCPSCNSDMRGTKEKGVDVGIATDMIMLAWEDTYDVGVLVSADSDFVPLGPVDIQRSQITAPTTNSMAANESAVFS